MSERRKPRDKPAFRLPPDEEVVAAATKVILHHSPVTPLRRFKELVEAELKERNEDYVISETRVRQLALRSGLVKVHIQVRMAGVTPVLASCPVCGNRLSRGTNQTLTGGSAQVGYRCSRCPWWTGREYRVPSRYTFLGRIERAGKKTGQTSFR